MSDYSIESVPEELRERLRLFSRDDLAEMAANSTEDSVHAHLFAMSMRLYQDMLIGHVYNKLKEEIQAGGWAVFDEDP